MSDKKICPFCGGVMTPIYNGDMTKHVVYEWECSRSSCQFSGGYFGADGLAHRNMKKIIKWKEEINALRSRIAELEESIEMKNEATKAMIGIKNKHIAKLVKQAITWHRYPDEKPDLKPIPSTKLHTLLAVVSAGGDPEVEMVIVEPTDAMLHWRRADYGWYSPEQILYWAYLPEPPREVIQDVL